MANISILRFTLQRLKLFFFFTIAPNFVREGCYCELSAHVRRSRRKERRYEMKWIPENELNAFKLNCGAPWLCALRAERRPAGRRVQSRRTHRWTASSILFSWLAGRGSARHRGTSPCITWPWWASGDNLAPLQAKTPSWVRLLLTGWFTWWRLPPVSRNTLWGKWDFGFRRAVSSHASWGNNCFRFSRCEALPLSSFERKKKKKTTTLCDNSGLCVIPESPTTAEALWKCDESTLKEMIGMFFFWLNLTSKRSQRDSQRS